MHTSWKSIDSLPLYNFQHLQRILLGRDEIRQEFVGNIVILQLILFHLHLLHVRERFQSFREIGRRAEE